MDTQANNELGASTADDWDRQGLCVRAKHKKVQQKRRLVVEEE